jgi:lysozyme-like protein
MIVNARTFEVSEEHFVAAEQSIARQHEILDEVGSEETHFINDGAKKPRGESDGVLAGRQLQPRDIAEFAYRATMTESGSGSMPAHELVRIVGVCLAESQGYDRARNDNIVGGEVVSRDCGLWQINIPASKIGTAEEERLYDPETNAAAMMDLFIRRGFQPWVAYTTGVYLHDSYLKRAARGFGNWGGEQMIVERRRRIPEYDAQIVQNILDFQYRPAGMVGSFNEVTRLANVALRSATAPAVVDALDKIKVAAANGRAWLRK